MSNLHYDQFIESSKRGGGREGQEVGEVRVRQRKSVTI